MLNIFGRFRWVGSNQMPTAMIIMAHFLTQTWLNYIWWIINCLKTSDIECEQQTINSRVGELLLLLVFVINLGPHQHFVVHLHEKGSLFAQNLFFDLKMGRGGGWFLQEKGFESKPLTKIFFWNISCHTAFECCIISMKLLKH